MEDRGLCRSCPILGLVATLSCAGFSAAGKRDEVDRAWPFWRGDAIVSHPSKPSTDIWELPLTCYWQGCTFCLSSVFIWFCYGWCCSSCWQAKVGGTKLVDLIFKSFWYSDPCSTSNCCAAVPLPQKAIWRHTHCGRRGGRCRSYPVSIAAAAAAANRPQFFWSISFAGGKRVQPGLRQQQGSFLPTGVHPPITCKLEEALYTQFSPWFENLWQLQMTPHWKTRKSARKTISDPF